MKPRDREIIAGARVEKRNYSHNPWRIVTQEGVELWIPSSFNHPDLGIIGIDSPLCFPRKHDAITTLAGLRKDAGLA